MARLTKYQQARLNEFVALHRIMHTALADKSTPVEVHYLLNGLVQDRLKELTKRDLKPVVDAFCKMDLTIPYLAQLRKELNRNGNDKDSNTANA